MGLKIKVKIAASPPKIIKIGIVHKTSALTAINQREKLPKFVSKIGRVAIWADVVIIKTSVRLFCIFLKNLGMYKIPAVAAKDNWNPVSKRKVVVEAPLPLELKQVLSSL